ncbi:TusE/DsrC/DsvC family sulfur relay protein [Salmonella enterica subsp. enterica]|nr:TusE/DsrC/DsvC family sulfur relay protein [Salmonella enterica subsp. enterica]
MKRYADLWVKKSVQDSEGYLEAGRRSGSEALAVAIAATKALSFPAEHWEVAKASANFLPSLIPSPAIRMLVREARISSAKKRQMSLPVSLRLRPERPAKQATKIAGLPANVFNTEYQSPLASREGCAVQ